MAFFTAGGVYVDDETGKPFFSLLFDENDKVAVVKNYTRLFRQVRRIGHIYRLSDDFTQLTLEVASEAAETNGVEAINFVDLNSRYQKELVGEHPK